MDLDLRRRFFADEIAAVANLRSAALVDALATVPRERFLPPGPWMVVGDGSVGAQPRQTPDADPAHVYHNYSVAIDPARQLFNGAPSLIAGTIEMLQLRPGARVLHVGAGLGYYTALMGHLVGPAGHVAAIEIDDALAADAQKNLACTPWIAIGNEPPCGEHRFDAILVNAGVTHPEPAWLDALAVGGRMILPLTAGIAAMGPIGKGVMTLVTRQPDDSFEARVLTFVAIYSAIGLRNEAINTQLGQALMRTPFPRLKRLRRDPHESSPACWLHTDDVCWSM